MYCSIHEAFDNSPTEQYNDIEKENNNNIYQNYINQQQDQFVSMKNLQFNEKPPQMRQHYFDAQGDLVDDYIMGTSITNLPTNSPYRDQRNNPNCNKSQQLPITDYSSTDEYSLGTVGTIDFLPKKQEPKKSHSHYIKKFIDSLSDDMTLLSNDDDVYNHVKGCKYCRVNIKKLISEKVISPVKKLYNEYIPDFNPGYSLKEIIVIIVIGIIIIFILDLFVRLGKKTRKLK